MTLPVLHTLMAGNIRSRAVNGAVGRVQLIGFSAHRIGMAVPDSQSPQRMGIQSTVLGEPLLQFPLHAECMLTSMRQNLKWDIIVITLLIYITNGMHSFQFIRHIHRFEDVPQLLSIVQSLRWVQQRNHFGTMVIILVRRPVGCLVFASVVEVVRHQTLLAPVSPDVCIQEEFVIVRGRHRFLTAILIDFATGGGGIGSRSILLLHDHARGQILPSFNSHLNLAVD
mmetsp:Transcript_17430/g.37623  ORF Transcript_17430/g.37623 Transcript_17430/m.37623 type:complete len:226 (-) Transcript_17430:410-1087(-)